MSQTVAGRINSIVNIHNPSIEVHLVDKSLNTGAVVILAAGGGHTKFTDSADQILFQHKSITLFNLSQYSKHHRQLQRYLKIF